MDKRVPEVRFKGFTDDWEHQKASTLLDSIVKKGYEYLPVLSVTQENGVVKRSDLNIDIKYDKSTLSNYKLVNKGDFIISLRSFQGGIELSNIDGIASPAYTIMKFKNENNDPYFWKEKFKTYNFIQSLKTVTFGIRDGKSISFSEFKTLKLKFPNNLTEQIKIGKLFNLLNKYIVLKQDQLALYEKLKKGLLQKLFPSDGENVPVVRFADFNEDWEQCKLGNLANIVRGASPRPIKNSKWFDENSEVGWLRISDVTEQNGRIYKLSQHISKLGQKHTRIVEEPHLLLSIAATVGKPVINYCKTGVHDGFLIFLNPEFDLEFMFQWLKMFQSVWNKYGQPGSQVNLNSDLVKNQKLFIPNRSEQQEISALLKKIDILIDLQNQEQSLIKKEKNFLLQNLFI